MGHTLAARTGQQYAYNTGIGWLPLPESWRGGLELRRPRPFGSCFRVHRHWLGERATDALLEENSAVADKDRVYRCLFGCWSATGFRGPIEAESLTVLIGALETIPGPRGPGLIEASALRR